MNSGNNLDRRSLLSLHKEILTGTQGQLSEEARDELERAEKFSLPPLKLPPIKKTRVPYHQWTALGGILLAASLLFYINYPSVQREQETGLRMKGSGQITVYWQRGQNVSILKPGAQLLEGDHIRTEILLPQESLLWEAVYTRDGTLLDNRQDVLKAKIIIPAKTKTALPGSIILSGSSEKETLAILYCTLSPSMASLNPNHIFAELQRTVRTKRWHQQQASDIAGCNSIAFPLRD